jgi:tRNA threonylcarbamoyladenosine biosynthesis protein TsaB
VRILAIETSMGRTSVALSSGQPDMPVLFDRLEASEPRAEGLIPLVGRLMDLGGVSFPALDLIAVCIGPGGFSGIRTGVAAARGIGLSANVPVVGATSFRIMSAAFEDAGGLPKTYGLAAPAGLSAVFCQVLAREGKALTDIVALPQAETGAFFKGQAEVLAGPAAASLLEGGYVSLPMWEEDIVPDARMLAGIAPSLDPRRDVPSPYYVRPADARPQVGHAIERSDE